MQISKPINYLISLIIVIICIGLPLYIGHVNGKVYDSAIRKNHSLTIGRINSYEHYVKHTPEVTYEFELDGIVYTSESSPTETDIMPWEDSYKRIYSKIKGKTFPVFFSRDNPAKYNKILIIQGDFKEFDMTYPDSLRWIRDLLVK